MSVSSRELVMSSSTDKKSKSSNEGTTWAEYRPSSGSTYYIHKVTREKVYEKPLELASPSEKIEILEKRKKLKFFFDEMEANINRRLSSASAAGTKTTTGGANDAESKSSYDRMDGSSSSDCKSSSSLVSPLQDTADSLENFFDFNRKGRASDSISGAIGAGSPGPGGGLNGGHARTISSLDLTTISQADDARVYAEVESLLGVHGGISMQADTKSRSAPFLSERKFSFDGNEFELPDSIKSDAKTTQEKMARTGVKKKAKRRNSTGTTYVTATLVKQDNDTTIMCVCRVLHAYILDASRTRKTCSRKFSLFSDSTSMAAGSSQSEHHQAGHGIDDKSDDWVVGTPEYSSTEATIKQLATSPSHGTNDKEALGAAPLPTVESIYLFFQCIFRTSQLESECIIIALIYLERLMKETNNGFCIRHDNWHSAVFVSLMMASKVWDDLSMWNSDFSQIIPGYDLDRLNGLELCVLEALHYDMKVPPGQYAKYYFILRSLISQLGLSTVTETEELLEGSSLDLAKSKAMSPMRPIHVNVDKVRPRARSKGLSNPKSMPDLLLALDRLNVTSTPSGAETSNKLVASPMAATHLDTHMRSSLEGPTHADGTRVHAPRGGYSNISSAHGDANLRK